MTKILHISDTHGFHNNFWLKLTIPEGIDIIIHSGDCSNYIDVARNSNEVLNFLEWYAQIDCKYRIYVAGNHDSSIEHKVFTRETFKEYGLIYLHDETINIDGLNIYGSPWSPIFGNWSFMKKREKLHDIWQQIPDDTDILVTHTPSKGILDLSEDRDRLLEQCGCNALLKRVRALKLKAHCFGHIHNREGIMNAGTMKIAGYNTIFSNGSCVTDGKFDIGLTSFGNIIEI